MIDNLVDWYGIQNGSHTICIYQVCIMPQLLWRKSYVRKYKVFRNKKLLKNLILNMTQISCVYYKVHIGRFSTAATFFLRRTIKRIKKFYLLSTRIYLHNRGSFVGIFAKSISWGLNFLLSACHIRAHVHAHTRTRRSRRARVTDRRSVDRELGSNAPRLRVAASGRHILEATDTCVSGLLQLLLSRFLGYFVHN